MHAADTGSRRSSVSSTASGSEKRTNTAAGQIGAPNTTPNTPPTGPNPNLRPKGSNVSMKAGSKASPASPASPNAEPHRRGSASKTSSSAEVSPSQPKRAGTSLSNRSDASHMSSASRRANQQDPASYNLGGQQPAVPQDHNR